MDRAPPTGRIGTVLILAAATIVGAMFLYGVAYVAFGQVVPIATPTPEKDRVFDAHWQAIVFLPAARIESELTGVPTQLWYSSHPLSSTLVRVP